MARNIWGTEKSDIDPAEYCPDCERAVPYHYGSCPRMLGSGERIRQFLTS